MKRKFKENTLAFEESLGEDWGEDVEMAEVPLREQSFFWLGVAITALTFVIFIRIAYLTFWQGSFYKSRAVANASQVERVAAPRGLIVDRNGVVLAENRPAFFALLDVREFIRHPETQEATLHTAAQILGIDPGAIWDELSANTSDQFLDSIVLGEDLPHDKLIQLKSASLPAIHVAQGFERSYPDGFAFSNLLGYTGFASRDYLAEHPELTAQDIAGKSGLEGQYDTQLQGKPGVLVSVRNSKGEVLQSDEKNPPQIGKTIHATIDAEFQSYLYHRLQVGLQALGRDTGVGVALNPQTGEVLAMVGLPSFDANIFSASGHSDEKRALLTSPTKPLFNRAVSGAYNPGSTIKPLVAVATLKEGVMTPDQKIYSPGYLDVPNPYDPEHPTRFVDWRPQGWVDVHSALAQSSNVYFYLAGGGSPQPGMRGEVLDGQKGIKGLGIKKLEEWWGAFGLGKKTGIDFPAEASGFLPGPEVKSRSAGGPWLIGDTYNVSIGQGTLLLTPIQLISYIASIANGGKIYKPFLVSDGRSPEVSIDLTRLAPQIHEVQDGMKQTVLSGLGTAHLLQDLPFSVGAKTGSAQVKSKTQQNAFFVGYAPADKGDAGAQIAVVILVENSKEGSANTIPIAKDVLRWYYEHRIKK
jgi:penicillin-binding protein 2